MLGVSEDSNVVKSCLRSDADLLAIGGADIGTRARVSKIQIYEQEDREAMEKATEIPVRGAPASETRFFEK